MTFSAWVASSNGALLEMSFQDITTGESIFTKTTSIWSHTSVYTAIRMSSYATERRVLTPQKVTFQMLCM